MLHGEILAACLLSSLRHLGDKFVLDEDEGLHGVLEGELVLAHLRQDSANVQVDVAWVRDLQTVVNCMLTKVQVVVFDLECFFEVLEGGSEFLGATENAGEVIVRHCAVTITFLSQAHSLVQKLKRYLEVLFL